jgi:hypothetical protein
MSDIRNKQKEESLPTHEAIEKRAFELYQQGGDEGTAIDYWLIAEAQLKAEHAKGASAFLKTKASLRRNNG